MEGGLGMSIALVLSHYLEGLKERDELDALLPELLRAMGHSVQSRPQTGVAQAGVDVVSTAINESGETEVFLFVIKFGDVGREDFYGGKQAIDPSIREAANEFIRNRLPAKLQAFNKKIVLLTNGVLKQEAQAGYAALSHDIASRPLCSLEFWGMYQLTPLIEAHLFDEGLLLGLGKSDLRAALAGIEDTHSAFRRFIRFVDHCFEVPPEEVSLGVKARKKKFYRRVAAAAMGWAVMLVWGRTENNLKPGVLAGEYLLLRLWSEGVKQGHSKDKLFHERMTASMLLYVDALQAYLARIVPQLMHRRVILGYRPERVLYADLIFEELGRCAQFLLLLQGVGNQDALRLQVHELIVRLVNEHTGCLLPVLDGQSIDLTLVLLALMGEGDVSSAKNLVRSVTNRLIHALKSNQYLPVDTDLIEDAVVASRDENLAPRTFFKTTTLVPALASVAAILEDEEALAELREIALPLLEGVTLERWFPTVELETLTGERKSIASVGVSRALSGIRPTASEEAAASLKGFEGAAAREDFAWHGTPWSVMPVLSARMHRHPLPTWFLAEYAPGGAGDGADTGAPAESE